MIAIQNYLVISALLFSIGLAVTVTKRNAILILMGIELMLNAVNLNMVAFSQYDPNRLQGQMFALFIMVIAAAEVTVALAIILKIYDYFKNLDLDEINSSNMAPFYRCYYCCYMTMMVAEVKAVVEGESKRFN
jgi:NADH-quinone oxidoreductase subunit K